MSILIYGGKVVMKKGISIWSFAGSSLEENMKLAKDAGFDGIELALDLHHLLIKTLLIRKYRFVKGYM